MLPLSPTTELLLNAAFSRESNEYRARVASILETDVGENIPFCNSSSPIEMERIRFAVIRLLSERQMAEQDVIDLAKKDWRDLLMAADFGYDTGAHLAWCSEATDGASHD